MRQILFILFLIVLVGCKQTSLEIPKIEEPEGLFHWPILKVEGQTTGSVGNIVTLDVICPTTSGCDYISKISSVNEGHTIYIIAFGGTLTNSPCTQAAVPIVVKYKFTPTTNGRYTLRFISKDNSIIEHHVTVY